MTARRALRGLLAVVPALALAGALTALAPVPPSGDRRPAPVMSHQGADWLERPGRDQEQRPEEVIRTMGLRDGDVVADVGCGTGYFARRMARAVAPSGRVYAVDVQPEMLDRMRGLLERDGITNVVPVLGAADDPRLPPAGLDWVLLVDVYHELQAPKPMLARIRDSLKPGGRVALVEYRLEGESAAHIRPEHRMSPDQVLAEWEPAGFRLAARHEFLPTQHFFVFERAEARVRAFVGARLWDGSGRPAVDDATVLVRDGRVDAVGPAGEVAVPAGATRIDLSGRFVVPGLVNAHGHVGETRGLESGPHLYGRDNVLEQLALYARYGVTTV
ncbi:MAG TPA: methyltransferase domain-containing protein, partial [Vicinamibacteria bacterium]|nr:methyltransferase domain-containing protein [Vicinamibacteria bacterium]